MFLNCANQVKWEHNEGRRQGDSEGADLRVICGDASDEDAAGVGLADMADMFSDGDLAHAMRKSVPADRLGQRRPAWPHVRAGQSMHPVFGL
jgi:hypothetical protein